MWNLADSMQRIRAFAVGAAILSIVPLLAEGAPLVHVKWEGLSMVVGKTVRIALPGGAVITGKATGAESDALVVNVTKTTDPKAQPKGELRVPRATLHVLHMRTKGKFFRVLGTTLGAGAGLAAGAIPAFFLVWEHGTAAWAAFIGCGAAGTIAGYLAGNAADRRWTTVEILP